MIFFDAPSANAPARRLVSVGECMLELAPDARPGLLRKGFAGDAFNTAWYARRLRPDWAVRFASRVGQDRPSDEMLAFMRAAGIETGHVLRCAARSIGVYMIWLEAGERSFSYWRERSAARLLAQEPDALDRAFADADLVYLSGITLAILEGPGRENLFAALERARARGAAVAFDPNIRPRLWPDAALMRQSVMRAAGLADIVLPSFDDEAAAFGDPDPQASAARYADAGARIVVVKNGGGPVAHLCEGRAGRTAPPPAGRIVDTTSAGDSFNAAFLAGLDHAADIETRILAATRVANQVIARKGALAPVDAGRWRRDLGMPEGAPAIDGGEQ
ncbi:sugar kinase [Oceanicella actignis]|uniref:sugar kinase n=1 Tax=Oceanicella actignis TaxID=1189325 RepID=UPI0011E87968|nr:sugar kinase [Oceanicella actignis]TYO90062.1 2-dehydro-3-deoxygluconokinase [Oceanicella actignis]